MIFHDFCNVDYLLNYFELTSAQPELVCFIKIFLVMHKPIGVFLVIKNWLAVFSLNGNKNKPSLNDDLIVFWFDV